MSGNKVLAVDLGEKRIGIAVSDDDRIIARPVGVITHISRIRDVEAILSIAEINEVNHILIGQSLGENGEETRQSRHATRFMQALLEVSEIPVTLWDESFSTQDARSTRVEMRVSRENRRGHLDELAAVIILQSYLDTLRKDES